MNHPVAIKEVVSWNQRTEPEFGAYIVSSNGNNWIEPECNQLHIAEAKEVGIYLGDGRVAAVLKPPVTVPVDKSDG